MTTDILRSHTIYHDSFEAREEAFNQSVSNLIPCKYKGPQKFWMDFNQIIHHRLAEVNTQSTAYISSNPRDCLAFGTSSQVLNAARLMAGASQSNAIPSSQAIASEFDLSDTIHQPIRTLSGGELVKLALAKTFILAPISRRLSIASPFCWLSQGNIHLLEKVVAAYRGRGIPVTIYALKGEDDLDEDCRRGPLAGIPQGPSLTLKTHNVTVSLKNAVTEIGAEPQAAAISDAHLQLVSPCLIRGENGQGKSLLAKALSGAIPALGDISINHSKKLSRLLFQDVINQTLLRSFSSLIGSQRCAEGYDAGKILNMILDGYHNFIGNRSETVPPKVSEAAPDLLTIKMVLIALRLCALPQALILDEPDWGLTRKSAEALVLSVIQCAHELSVPILIISHKPWWEKLVKSFLWVQKRGPQSHSKALHRFTITLKESEPLF